MDYKSQIRDQGYGLMPMYYFVVLSRVPLFNGIGWRVVIAAPTSFESSFWS